ncbi:MAG: protein kinase [Deltaproteobacteria bacterium]|nr:protein kinase [Deltaproteobacteria bacterium]
MNKPTPFGKYYLLERINVGGMAEVFKAKTVGVEGFERIVALKRILPSIAEDEEFITMFIDEAKIAVQLQHANIAQIFDLGKVDDSYFIALEFVNGRDLRGIFEELRKSGQVMPVPQVCYLVMQLCEGLDYAHNKRDMQGRELNLVHRDVSPQNVLVGFEGEVKLIDFGIAKAAGKASKTQAGILKGKFGYMSPEQVRGLPIDRRSDIFALGIVLYEMLTNERLFIGESDFSTLEKVRNVEIIPPSSFNSEIPDKLERIVLKALEKNVEDRYQNAIDLHDDLQLFLHSVGQFSSRKDLSAWMKRVFASDMHRAQVTEEVAEEIEEIEDVEAIAVDGQDEADAAAGEDGEEFGWDEEEKETQIFDKEPATLDPTRDGSFLADGGEKTVAMEPSEALLAEMGEAFETQVPTRPTASAALPAPQASPRPTHAGAGRSAEGLSLPAPSSFPSFAQAQSVPRRSAPYQVVHGPADPARVSFDLPKPAFRQTLLGGAPAPTAPQPSVSSSPSQLGTPAYPTLQPVQPPPGLPAPSFPGATFPGAPVLPPYASGVDLYPPARLRPPSRLKYYVAFVLFMVVGGAGAYIFMTRPGMLQISVRPPDARLAVDGVLITAGPPFQLVKRPGVYRLTVSRVGYVTREQVIQISAGQAGHMDIELEASPDTGFELTSQPSGGLVWLDGRPLTVDEHGKQATTNFLASRIPPGPHVIEIKGNPLYQDWRQEFLQEPGRTVRLHAVLVPVSGAGKTGAPSRVTSPPTAEPAPTPAPSPAASGLASGRGKASEKPRGASRRGEGSSRSLGGEDIFEAAKTLPGSRRKKPAAKPSVSDEDIFESHGKGAGAATGGCIATISSKPWAEVSIDGKPTGKITPLVNYPIPCGKHRLTFKNADLMIERNESVTLRPGQPFKKIFSLVEMEL